MPEEKPTKFCEFCHTPLTRRVKETAKRFSARRFCGNQCAYKARPSILPKLPIIAGRTCRYCGEILVMKPKEGPNGFARKKFCSRICRDKGSVHGPPRRPPEERFWGKVYRHGPIPAACPSRGRCWLWTGSRQRRKRDRKLTYGVISTARGVVVYAHRIAYEIHYGSIPDGLDVLHRCDVEHCVRWNHPYAGNAKQNARDMWLHWRAGASRLTERDVRSIRWRYHNEAVSKAVLAVEYGITAGAIFRIVKGRTFKHVPMPQKIP